VAIAGIDRCLVAKDADGEVKKRRLHFIPPPVVDEKKQRSLRLRYGDLVRVIEVTFTSTYCALQLLEV